MDFEGYKFKFRFNASHYLNREKPEDEHPHTFHIVVYLENENGNFISYKTIEEYVKIYLDMFMGKCLNDVSPFDEIQPSIENICIELYSQINQYCDALEVKLKKIAISDNSIFWYSISSDDIFISSLNDTIERNKIEKCINIISRSKEG